MTVRIGLAIAVATILAACPNIDGREASLSTPAVDMPEARDCVIMGYRIGTSRHDYCIQVMSRRVTPEEYN